jgi:hypothetical protein
MAREEGADQRNTKADAKDNHYDNHAEGRRVARGGDDDIDDTTIKQYLSEW